MAWLSAVPEGGKDKRSRYEQIRSVDENSIDLELPDVDPAEYLVALLHEVGPVESNGYGPTTLSWKELDSWIERTALDLTPWEILMIRKMSEAYAAEHSKASKRDALPPYKRVVLTQPEISNKLGAMLRARKRN